jgi:hypothetical protein
MGKMKRYLRLVNPFYVLISTLKSYRNPLYPQVVGDFVLVQKDAVPDYAHPFNSDIAEFVRDRKFLTWRFFEVPHRYAMYKHQSSNDYFVARIIKRKGIAMLALVDYRCRFTQAEHFENVLVATQKLAQKMCCGFIITSSTLLATDEVLEKSSFRKIMKDKIMVSTAVKKEHSSQVNERRYVLVTLADSDGEISW